MKKILVLLFLCAIIATQAQNTNGVKRGPEDSYTRSSISYLLLDFANDKYARYLRNAIENVRVPQKFDNNSIATKYIHAPYNRSQSEGEQANVVNKPQKIGEALKNHKYASEVMRYWWKVQDDGSFSTKLIQDRGLYNATDIDVNQVDASKLGRAKLADAGMNLIGKSYVLVLDYHNIKTMKEIYDAQDARAKAKAKKESTEFIPVHRRYNGFRGELTAYLFKLNYSDTIQGYLDESFIDENKIDVDKFDDIFNHINSPYQFVTLESGEVSGKQLNPGESLAPARQKSPEELFKVLVHSSALRTLANMERYVAAFRVKTPVTSIKPIKAKVGRKEGIRHERRFFVWEYVSNRREKVIAKKVATIRASHVVNNMNDALGRTQESEFYQIGGRVISEGMTLQERKDLGIGIAGGFGTMGLHFQLDANVGQLVDLPLKQLKLYGEFFLKGLDYEDVMIVEGSTMEPDGQYNELVWSVGILKEYPIFRGNFRAGWKLGVTGDSFSWEADENHLNYNEDSTGEGISALGLSWGINLGVNLFSPSIHLIASLGGYHHFGAVYNSGIEGDEGVQLENKITDIFPNKNPISMDLSIRFSF